MAAGTAEILLVEDKDSLRRMLRLALEAAGYLVAEARDGAQADDVLAQRRPALVLTDLRLPVGDGFSVLRSAKDTDPDVPVVVMTAFGGIEDAVRAMKEGALDFLAKPVDPEHLLLLVGRALEQRRLATENLLLREELAVRRGLPHIIGEHAALRKVMLSVQRAAQGDTTVLIEGESGTGKELVARALHALSGRSPGPFVAINCAAIPENLLESELFGYEKGAFTGAVQRKAGKFELAHRGTLFLDEIGDMPLTLQPKILRALEERRFERVGGNIPLQIDVRLVAATNKNLKAAVAARRFREDLYFRLSVLPIQMPALRERATDIPLLAQHFIERFSRDLKKRVALAPAALDALCAHAWPGQRARAAELPGTRRAAGRGRHHPSGAPPVGRGAGGGACAHRLRATRGSPSTGTAGCPRCRGARWPKWSAARSSACWTQTGGDRNRAADQLQVPLRFLQSKLRELRME